MQPSVSFSVLPICISTPSYPGTPISLGTLPPHIAYCSRPPNLGLTVFIFTRYLPVGIAVTPFTFIPQICATLMLEVRPLSLSSSVSQTYVPSTYILPIVYASFFAILFTLISIPNPFLRVHYSCRLQCFYNSVYFVYYGC